jgi:hypothetical protein
MYNIMKTNILGSIIAMITLVKSQETIEQVFDETQQNLFLFGNKKQDWSAISQDLYFKYASCNIPHY